MELLQSSALLLGHSTILPLKDYHFLIYKSSSRLKRVRVRTERVMSPRLILLASRPKKARSNANPTLSHITKRIHPHTIYNHLKMQMNSRTSTHVTSISHQSNSLSCFNILTRRYQQTRMMAIQSFHTTTMIDLYITTITSIPTTLRKFNSTRNIKSVMSPTKILCNHMYTGWPNKTRGTW